MAQRIFAAVLLVLSAPLWLGFAILIRVGSRGQIIVGRSREGGPGDFSDVEVTDDVHCDADARLRLLADRAAAEDGDAWPTTHDPRVADAGTLARHYASTSSAAHERSPRRNGSSSSPTSAAGCSRPPARRGPRGAPTVAPGMTGLWQVGAQRTRPRSHGTSWTTITCNAVPYCWTCGFCCERSRPCVSAVGVLMSGPCAAARTLRRLRGRSSRRETQPSRGTTSTDRGCRISAWIWLASRRKRRQLGVDVLDNVDVHRRRRRRRPPAAQGFVNSDGRRSRARPGRNAARAAS